ncbi:MAG: gamma-glutamyl-gamma-aminobutyrate hydrolase family protein [Solirubrobacterales bacterium]
MSRRPVVGICAAIEQARWGSWDVEVNLSQRTYSREVAAAGAQPILLPATEEMTSSPEEVIGLLDALILAGGGDVDPASYGAGAGEHTANVRPERDAFEMALARAALERDLPLLGVCRGMEVLNVALGGDLVQHLDTTDTHLHTPGTFTDHDVLLEPGSLAARAAGAERISVRSHHHQGLGRLGEGLVVSGRAPDGVLEAVEIPGKTFALGVIWHAEEERDSPLLHSFVAATRAGVAAG